MQFEDLKSNISIKLTDSLVSDSEGTFSLMVILKKIFLSLFKVVLSSTTKKILWIQTLVLKRVR